ncbi:cupin domain-containing protein [Noviherbaspirillum sp. CPCC 100848]|uniref:Cupin domain-containing protein n=1 Tax=Noviherbaspirillum album TaxID=3080276 RepID=A0ABU6JG08_9BURK|nr:cupin domain-containing protein [Noviherbaspirillum sp. CPCC 100848]MEC4722606.1 cupin domain-containing protein [Noviherbaspirillum sp. CPCC 100848]
MSLHHATPGELIDIRPLGDKLVDSASLALVRTDDFEVMRLVLPQGKSIPEHRIEGELTLQCLEGTVEVETLGQCRQLRAGQMIYLQGNTPYALAAPENASVLMTMLRKGTDSKAD